MKNRTYWKERFEQLEQSQNQKGMECFADIERQYRKAQREIEAKIAKWYQRFADNNDISLAKARKMLKKKELEELKWDIDEYIRYGKENARNGAWIKQLENASARYHISRLEAIQLHLQQIIEEMFEKQFKSIDSAMKDIYSSDYYHTAFEIQKGIGIGWDFSALDENLISKVINKPWAVDGKNFSERIWGNRQKLLKELNNELTKNIILGQDPQKAIDAIAKKMNTSKNAAGRLVMTEEAFFSSAARKDCFEELDVEQFEVVATLDSKTSEICRNMDGKHFPMAQWEVGVTAPPFHVWCRSTVAPYFDDEFDYVGKRAARREDGNVYYVPADMTYREWKQEFVKDSISDDMKKTYEKYQKVLGNNLPTIEEFTKIRYNEKNWKTFKSYAASIKTGELTPLTDFTLYQNISKEIDEKIVGIVTRNGIKITGKSNHSIARVIGSVEQRRNGVSITDVLASLINEDAEIFPVRESKNGKSQKFRNQKVEVSVNPDTGKIIQVNPVHGRKKMET